MLPRIPSGLLDCHSASFATNIVLSWKDAKRWSVCYTAAHDSTDEAPKNHW